MRFSELKNKILDLVFPIHCLGCGRAGEWVCENCFGFINLMPVFLCPKCGNRSYLGRVCERCLGKSHLTGVIAMGRYNDKLLQNLVKSLKFRLLTALEPVLGRLIKKFCLKYSQVFPANAILIPVPLHSLRFRERGFNQAEIVAKAVSDALAYQVDLNSLKRSRYTFRQSELPAEMKAGNIKDAFKCEGDLAGRVVILADDVYTSGATMQECARTLKEAGAKEVWGFVLARG
jgi:competence protein ComFC